ncbi:hypothetical protein UFOVP1528_7 [uncultured Caudovirales phage]|uniref:Uncharacterized protein n=1 Tax=uncultured Caudovirales phage TaxID=2100421 RepID=A0A6J5QG02_9CAUD|nr:hypothetical protein UFOVP1080_6 [uncultured Caudovirales phage]CAB4197850.1 hypothetical protein UFOVP1321_44 [uncultured Caudovirales phage]CAB5227145.1 hypothetical protein UFOVP1528_7 [uncultured Caudovirales phage]
MRLADLKDLVSNQVNDPEELVSLLEISIEDLMDRFADRLIDNKEKFGVYDDDDSS